MNLVEHMRRVMAFSRATWGPDERTKGVCHHIREELKEVENKPDGGLRSNEWVDVTKLGLDGLWRSLAAEGCPHDKIPEEICRLLLHKQDINELRIWPDWRTANPDKAIEHIRECKQ